MGIVTSEVADARNARMQQNKKDRAKASKQRAENVNEDGKLKVGDFVVNTWGYGQTNVDFYVVVKRTKCFVSLQRVCSKVTSSVAWASDMVVPTNEPHPRYEKITRHKVGAYSGQEYCTMQFGSGSKWNGQPVNETSYH